MNEGRIGADYRYLADTVCELEDGGLSVGEFSSPLMKGPEGRYKPGDRNIAQAARDLKAVLQRRSDTYRNDHGTLR